MNKLLWGWFQSDAVSSTAGTPAFLAPEVCSESSYEGRPVDIWALGVRKHLSLLF